MLDADPSCKLYLSHDLSSWHWTLIQLSIASLFLNILEIIQNQIQINELDSNYVKLLRQTSDNKSPFLIRAIRNIIF